MFLPLGFMNFLALLFLRINHESFFVPQFLAEPSPVSWTEMFVFIRHLLARSERRRCFLVLNTFSYAAIVSILTSLRHPGHYIPPHCGKYFGRGRYCCIGEVSTAVWRILLTGYTKFVEASGVDVTMFTSVDMSKLQSGFFEARYTMACVS